MSVWLSLSSHFLLLFISPTLFFFLPHIYLRFPSIHLTLKKGLRTNSSPGDQQDWNWVLSAEIQDNCVTPGMREEGLLIIGREGNNHCKKQPHNHLVFFSISPLSSSQSCSDHSPEPAAHSGGGGEKPKETEVAAAPRWEERSGSGSCRIEAHAGFFMGTMFLFRRGTCVSQSPWNDSPAKGAHLFPSPQWWPGTTSWAEKGCHLLVRHKFRSNTGSWQPKSHLLKCNLSTIISVLHMVTNGSYWKLADSTEPWQNDATSTWQLGSARPLPLSVQSCLGRQWPQYWVEFAICF